LIIPITFTAFVIRCIIVEGSNIHNTTKGILKQILKTAETVNSATFKPKASHLKRIEYGNLPYHSYIINKLTQSDIPQLNISNTNTIHVLSNRTRVGASAEREDPVDNLLTRDGPSADCNSIPPIRDFETA